MQVLLKFGIKIATETKLDSLLELIAEETRLILEADRCTVYLHDRKTDELWSMVAHGIGSGKIRFPSNKGLAGEVFTSRQTLNIPNAYKDHRFNPSFDQKTGYKTKTILAMPMLDSQNKELLGVFQVLNKSKGRLFDKIDEDLLTILGGHAAGAIENAQLYENLRNAQIETVFRLALAAEYRDQEDTAAHLKRMSTYTALIAEGLGYSPDYVETLRLAAPMHDVGKVATPDSILLKPGKLTEGEMARIEHRLFYWIEKIKLSGNSQKIQEIKNFLEVIRQANNPSSTQMNQEIVDQLLHIATQKYTDIDNHEKPLLKDDELKKLTIRRGNLTIEEPWKRKENSNRI